MSDHPEDIRVDVQSMYGAQTRAPLVDLRVGAARVCLSPAKAREIGLMLVEVSFAAEGDAFLVAFIMERVGVDLEHAVPLLQEFRQWREKRTAT